jgi:hypothetical protein
MNATIESGIPAAGSAQRAFVDAHPQAQGVHSDAWIRIVLQEVGGEFRHITVTDENGAIAAWMPLFLKDGPEGVVVNASAFYGSHGGILAVNDTAFDAAAAACVGLLREQCALGATIIEPLQDPRSERYGAVLPVVATTDRFAHVKSLAGLKTRDDVLASVNGLTRSNLKRKCWKSGILVEADDSAESVDWMIALHSAQMTAKGARPKTREFFHGLLGNGHDHGRGTGRLYVGRIGGERVAAVFMFVWRQWADYITPVFDMEARESQPLTAVIADAMLDLAAKGAATWNFGGSGEDLGSVVSFKETWGCDVLPYRYHVVDVGHIERLKTYARERGTEGYRGYYLYPFKRA